MIRADWFDAEIAPIVVRQKRVCKASGVETYVDVVLSQNDCNRPGTPLADLQMLEPIFPIPPLLNRFGVQIADIDLWEIREAFAAQAVYCAEHLGLSSRRLIVDSGAIAIGHPYGMSSGAGPDRRFPQPAPK